MITLPRSLVRTLRLVFGRGLGLTVRSRHPPVHFQPSDEGLRVRMRNELAALEYLEAGQSSKAPFALPLEALKTCEGTKLDLVTFEPKDGDQVHVSWLDRGIPQEAQFPLESTDTEFPEAPDLMQSYGPDLLAAMRDAVQTTDPASTRYALNCIQLGSEKRGKGKARVVATDGRQLLVQTGFSFPWKGHVLIPANPVFVCPEIHRGSQVEIGKSEDWVIIRTGNWIVHLRIQKEARFPRVDDHIPDAAHAISTLHISDPDAEFVTEVLKTLPATKESSAPVTVDLNGQVAIRAKAEDQTTPTELVLAGSRYQGQPILINTNRQFFARALSLGFRDVHFDGQEAPAHCQDAHRHYVWAVLEKGGIIKPSDQCVRMESISASKNEAPQPTPKEDPPQMATNRISPPKAQEDQPKPHTAGEAVGIDALIESAETVRTSLRESAAQLSELIAGLKQHRKQSKSLQSALSSIRALQGIEP